MRILYLQSETSLNSFGEACLSVTPKVFLFRDHEIFLDIGVTSKWFGGELKIIEKVKYYIDAFTLTPRLALVDRPEWAKALCYDARETLLAEGKSGEHLLALPIQRIIYCGDPQLEDEERADRIKLAAFMKRVGLKTIADFANLNATAIERRFGKLGIRLHQWVLGMRELCFPSLLPPESLTEQIDASEIGSLEQLLLYLQETFRKIEMRLEGLCSAARQVELTFSLSSGVKEKKLLKFNNPIKESNEFIKIAREYLNQANWDSPLEEVSIGISDLVPFNPGQLSLFDKTENSFTDLAQYIERLRNRLGKEAVGFADLQESYVPERSWENKFPPTPQNQPKRHPWVRPPILFNPPRPYRVGKNAPLFPSEHLATEWWEGGGYRRYYISQTTQGERVWIFWDCQKQQWFLQGTFD